MAASRVDELLSALRGDGGRTTVQKRAVVAALLDGPRHVTADELGATVQRTNPEVAMSTVYRILDTLERQGLVQHAHMGHGPAVYHLAEGNHLHLVCENCGGVVEVPESVYASFTRRLARDYEFTASPHHFAMHGRCARCGPPAPTPR